MNSFTNIIKLIRYNIKVIFANRFKYFIGSAILVFILSFIGWIYSNNIIYDSNVYNMLVFPAILLVFYPSCYGIQNDKDLKTIELIFGIPNYRFKIWGFRLIISLFISFVITLILSTILNITFVDIPVFEISFQVMIPTMFISVSGFMLSSILKNGNTVAVVLIIIGIVFYIYGENMQESKWNIFINPYLESSQMPVIFARKLVDNRIIMIVSSIFMLIIGFFNTKNREKFI